MLILALILFVVAAVFGIINLLSVAQGRQAPRPSVFLHGCAVGLAVLMVLSYMLEGHYDNLIIASVVLYVLAGMGGVVMFLKDRKGEKVPRAFIFFHPLLGLSGVVTLLVYAMQ